MSWDRFLLDPDAADARCYEIRGGVYRTEVFTTGGVNGKSADDTAIGNLLDYTESHDGTFTLYYLPNGPSFVTGREVLARAMGGVQFNPEEEQA